MKYQIKDDVFIHLKRKDDTLFDLNLYSKLIEYKKLAADWAKLLKEIRIDKKIAEAGVMPEVKKAYAEYAKKNADAPDVMTADEYKRDFYWKKVFVRK